MTDKSIPNTIQHLFETVGIGLLEHPLRLEAFLRDLHPDKPAEVSVLVESILSGSVEQLLRRTSRSECIATLSAKSGIAPRYSDWAMQLWSDVIPKSALLEPEEKRTVSTNIWEGSVEEILGKYRNYNEEEKV